MNNYRHPPMCEGEAAYRLREAGERLKIRDERIDWIENNGFDAAWARDRADNSNVNHPIVMAQLREILNEVEECSVRGFSEASIEGRFWGSGTPEVIHKELEGRGFIVVLIDESTTKVSW